MGSKDRWSGLGYVLAVGGLSRLVVVGTMVGVAPLLPLAPGELVAKTGWAVFSAWDSQYYAAIAEMGYQPGPVPLTAFFPLFPLLCRGVMNLGLPFQVAAPVVNNLTFLAALGYLYNWLEDRYDRGTARWGTAVLAWCPLSLFASVAYSEGAFLLCSCATMRAFDRHQYAPAAGWGMLATACRPTGVALIPALLIAAYQEKHPGRAYVAGLAALGGIGLFSLYCWIYLGDPLAFFHAQRFWRPSLGFDWAGWLKMVVQVSSGAIWAGSGALRDPWHPWLFTASLTLMALAGGWCRRPWLARILLGLAVLVQWLVGGDPWTNLMVIGGGAYLLGRHRQTLSRVTLVYGVLALALILASGSTISLNRLGYGVISLSVALGIELKNHPAAGWGMLGFFGLVLVSMALRFAQGQWVA